MKKKIGLFWITTLLVVGLCACTEPAQEPEPSTEETQTEVTIPSVEITTSESTQESESQPEIITPVDQPELQLLEVYTSEIIREKCAEDTGEQQIYIRYPEIYLGETVTDAPGLEDSLAQRNAQLKTRFEDSFIQMEDWLKVELEDAGNYGYEVYLPYYDEMKYNLLRADDHVLSLQVLSSSFGGGVHGYYSQTGIAYDTASGEELKLGAVVKDPVVFSKEVAQSLKDRYADCIMLDIDEYLGECFDQEDTTLDWSIDYAGITFYFNPYQIASFADGILTARFLFADHPDWYEEYYTAGCEKYSMGGSEFSSFLYDLNRDGVEDSFSTSMSIGESGNYDSFAIQMNASYDNFSVEADEIQSFLTVADDGKMYLVSEMNALMTDYAKKIVIYDVSGPEPQQLQIYENLGAAEICLDVNEQKYGRIFPTNPEKISLCSELKVLKKHVASRPYRLEAYGELVPTQDYYQINSQYVIVSKADLVGTAMDEYGVLTGRMYSVDRGKEMYVVRTDDSTYLDVRVENELVRIPIEKKDDGYYIGEYAMDDILVRIEL